MDPAPSGLTASQVSEKLRQFGPNSLPEKPPPTQLQLFLRQLKSPLVYILIAAGIVSVATGEYSDAVIIGFAVILNTVLGFFQEGQANRSLQALKRLISSTSAVVRDGRVQNISSLDLVPGDVVLLKPGQKIPADGLVLSANRLLVAEAIITGESVPLEKKPQDPLYMGTVVTAGLGQFQVTATGANTKMGQIALETQSLKEDTPLQQQLSSFSQKLVLIVLGLSVGVFIFGLFSGISWQSMFTLAVAVAVSSIPEGLLVAMTVILAIGMQRIHKRQGLVKKLSSAETLGGVTVICTDKTGTLTLGQLRVVDSLGDKPALALQILMSKDDPMVSAARDWASAHCSPEAAAKYPLLDSIPFSPQQKYFASLHRFNDHHNLILVNGAPEMILNWVNLPAVEKQHLCDQMASLTSSGQRILGLARKLVSPQQSHLNDQLLHDNLEWVGILVYADPVRPGVKDVLRQAQMAGIRIILITGDYPATAKFVMQQIGLPVEDRDILLGDQVRDLPLPQLAAKLKSVRLLARTSPDQKLKIVAALKSAGEIVAMMGDGVNDAPALHESDIGIVVAGASDVARESADLILLDSNFKTVLSAIEEGRVIFDNIRKVILYLLSDAFEEIVVIVGSLLLHFPIPLTAIQILWINLFSDGFPSLALTVDPGRPSVMREYPRSPREPLVNRWMVRLIMVISGLYGLTALLLFRYVYLSTGNEILVRSVAYVTLGINTLFYVFSVRNLWTPVWHGNIFNNKWLNISLLLAFIMQFLPFTHPALLKIFGLQPISAGYWFLAVGMSLAMAAIIEVLKTGYHRQRRVILAESAIQTPRKK